MAEISNDNALGAGPHGREPDAYGHPPIVPLELWEQVQAKLADNGPRLRRAAGTRHQSLLVGLITDGLDRRMSPSHATKGSKRYRYYITHSEAGIDDAHPAWRVSAYDLERIVVERLRAFLADGAAVHASIRDAAAEPRRVQSATAAAAHAATGLAASSAHGQRTIIARHVSKVRLRDNSVEIVVRCAGLLLDGMHPVACVHRDVVLTAPTARVRRGHEIRLVIPSVEATRPVDRDERLVELIADADAARVLLLASPDRSIDQIASAHGRCRTQLARLIKLSYLAPDIVTMILDGRQPARLTRRALMAIDLPVGWTEQRSQLGCA